MRIAGLKKIFNQRLRKRRLFFILLILGVAARLYLVFSLPIWGDEAYSIWASEASFLKILSGAVDPVHPPGYYIFLKLWSVFSNHLIWLRLSSVFFFVINVYFLYKIGLKTKDKIFSFFLVFFYIFSGYFVIFDWQVRMYAGVTTLILISLFLLLNKTDNKRLLLFTLVNAIGLYFDYGFFWYFIPLCFFLFFKMIFNKDKRCRNLFFSLILSLVVFFVWFPFFFRYYQKGILRVGWMRPYLSPLFFVPYFLGSHKNHIFTFLLLAMALFGLYIFWQGNRKSEIFQIITFCAFFSSYLALLYSILISPIFHIRSLQIVGLALVFLCSLVVYWLNKKKENYLVFFIIPLVLVNFFLTTRMFSKNPGQLLLQFFPWRKVRVRIEEDEINYVLFKRAKKLPTELLIWGLKYTLDGKETLFSKKIPHREMTLPTSLTGLEYLKKNCELIPDSLLRIYGCK